MPIVTVTRRLRFNAAHRVHNPALSDAENSALYGKCNNPNWHGHNYVLEVSVTGPVDERKVLDELDHSNMNVDVPIMRGINPTAENIVLAIWRALESRVAPGRLARLKLWETENNYVEYSGE